MGTDKLQIGRRSFLIGTGALALSALPVPAVEEEWPEYVRFREPEIMWHKEWNEDFWHHQTVWRPGNQMFGLGINISAVDIFDGRLPRLMRAYNRSLELTRRKYDFPREMIMAAANDPDSKRWVKKASGWVPVGATFHGSSFTGIPA